ncbi:MAG: FAD/NAD(P)-binding oxidoreductase [Rhodoglobus sp.]
MNTDAPVVIVGAAMGGLRTAEAARRAGYAGRLLLIGDEVHAPYNRPPLSKDVLSAGVTHEAVAFPTRAEMGDVEWMLGHPVASADLEANTVTTEAGVQPFRALVIATGLRPRRLDFAEQAGRHAIRSLDDALALRHELVPGARVTVIGSGFLGCELASTATKLGCTVTVVTPSAEPMIRPLGELLAAQLRERLQALGVTFELDATVAGMAGGTQVEGVELADGRVIPSDVVIEAIGSDCNDAWLHGTGLDLSDGVLTDNALRAIGPDGPRSDIYVVGDIARFPNPMFDDVARRVEHWNIPTDTGKRAGAVLGGWLAGDDAAASQAFAPMPSFWSNQFDIKLQAYGLPGLADEVTILEGELTGEVAVGYLRAGTLVGVVGVGLKAALLPYRQQISEGAASTS